MTRVKICGLQHPEHIDVAVKKGVDFLGFVFAKSKRQLSVEKAAHLNLQVPKHVTSVGVFVNASYDELEATIEQVGLDMVQLHGDEPPELGERLSVPYIKSLSIKTSDDLKRLSNYASADYILLDSGHGPYRGGNGTTFDWSLLEEEHLSNDRLILAGGLNVNNVNEAIRYVSPAIVDVSSGVETDGVKDEMKIQSFLQQVKGGK